VLAKTSFGQNLLSTYNPPFIYLHMPSVMALMFRRMFRKDARMTPRDLIGRANVASLSVAGLFILAVSATDAPAACRPAWSETLTPRGSNSFYGIAAIAPTEVWAVGSHYDGIADRPLAEHFDGIQWVTVNTPNPGLGAAYLRGVGGALGTDVWAAGYWETTSGANKTLIEHYDGTSWTIVPSPNPPSAASYLSTVAAVATDDVWVAGHYLDNTGIYRTLVEHWDGTSWTIVSSPNVGNGDNSLNGIAAAGPNDIWAVGYQSSAPGGASSTLVLHFDGRSWTIVPSPNPGGLTSSLAGVAAMADGRIWAAGFYYDGTQGRTLLLHGDSSGFETMPGEDFPGEGNVLNGIAASGLGDIFAAGYHYPNGTSDYQALIEHYDGEQWRRVSSAQGASYTYLSGITAQPAGAAWAVGNTLTGTIAESVCEIQLSEAGFFPRAASAILGDTVGWTITGGSSHRLVDASGMQLFDSGSRAPGSSFQFTFDSAGTYRVTDRTAHLTSTVAVPVGLPETGTTGVPLTVTWSAAPPSEGFLFDVQIRTPSDRGFHNWQVGQTDISTTFVPPVEGAYAFRARLRDSATGKFSKWSPSAVVAVENP
jgi:plastocyanin